MFIISTRVGSIEFGTRVKLLQHTLSYQKAVPLLLYNVLMGLEAHHHMSHPEGHLLNETEMQTKVSDWQTSRGIDGLPAGKRAHISHMFLIRSSGTGSPAAGLDADLLGGLDH